MRRPEALEAFGHPEAARIRREADAYGKDLRRGFETMRQHCPLVRLRNGRWVPYYPSQLYRRGRDVGWIRETLEGSVYLLLSGLYDPRGPEAQWILDDYPGQPLHVAALRLRDRRRGERLVQPGRPVDPAQPAGRPHALPRSRRARGLPLDVLQRLGGLLSRRDQRDGGASLSRSSATRNTAHPKTSDEANAVMWLRYMFVYGNRDGLFLGRAIPRAWFAQPRPIGLENVTTRWGKVSVRYLHKRIHEFASCRVDLKLAARPPRTVIRFRAPG